MNKCKPSKWINGLALVVVAGFLGVAGWIGWIQLHEHEKYLKIANANFQRKVLRPPLLGLLLDCHGHPLATSEPVKTVCANPSLMGTNHLLVARTIAPYLGLAEHDLYQQVRPRVWLGEHKKPVTNAYVVLARKIPLDTWQQITQAMVRLFPTVNMNRLSPQRRLALEALRWRSVFGEDDFVRRYPNGPVAAHALGYVSYQDVEGDWGRMLETRGWEGIERVFDRQLFGAPGWRKFRQDLEPRAGLTVVLTLDIGLQTLLEAELAKAAAEHRPKGIVAVILRPRTGEVLGLAVWPGYDPNRPGAASDFQRRNRALIDPLEPGSVFKVATISAALDAGAVTLETPIDCSKQLYPGKRLQDTTPHGVLKVEEVLIKSSNNGAANIAFMLGQERFYPYLTSFGFGSPTGILLPGESPGLLRPVAKWQSMSISRIAIGYEILATPLQVTMCVGAIANEGRIMRPLLVAHLEDEHGRILHRYEPAVVRQVVSPATAGLMVKAMKGVVSSRGTAAKAKLDYFTAAGKTGTTKKLVNGSYDSKRYVSSFVGFYPADRPELCIGVFVDDPDVSKGYYGGSVSGPIFKGIAEKAANYLRLEPELPLEEKPEPKLKRLPEPGNELARGPSYESYRARAPVGRQARQTALD